MGIEIKISSLLRGLTFNGRYGAIVKFDSLEKKGEDVFTIPAEIKSHSLDSAIKEILIPSFKNYVERNGTNPKVAVLEGVGSFLISDSFDLNSSELKKTEINSGSSLSGSVKGKISVVTGGAQGFGEGW